MKNAPRNNAIEAEQITPIPVAQLTIVQRLEAYAKTITQNIKRVFESTPKPRRGYREIQTYSAQVEVLEQRQLLSAVSMSPILEGQLTDVAIAHNGLETAAAIEALHNNQDFLAHLAAQSAQATTDIATFNTPADTGNWLPDTPLVIKDGALHSTSTGQTISRAVDIETDWELGFELTQTSGYTGGNRFEQTVTIGKENVADTGYTVQFNRSGWRYNDSSIVVFTPDGNWQRFNTPFQFNRQINVTLRHTNNQLHIGVTDPDSGSTFTTSVAFNATQTSSSTVAITHHYYDSRNSNPIEGTLDNVQLTMQDAYDMDDWFADPANLDFIHNLSSQPVTEPAQPNVQFTPPEITTIQPAIWTHSIQGNTVHILLESPEDSSTVRFKGSNNALERVHIEHTDGARLHHVFLPLVQQRNFWLTDATIELVNEAGTVVAETSVELEAGRISQTSATTWNDTAYQEQIEGLPEQSTGNNAYNTLIADAAHNLAADTLDTLGNKQHWGQLWNELRMVQLPSGQVGMHYNVGGLLLQQSTFFISQEDYMHNVYASRPDVFTPDGQAEPGMLNAWNMLRHNATEDYNNMMVTVEQKFQLGAQLLAATLNTDPQVGIYTQSLENSGWQWGNFTVRDGSVHGHHAIFNQDQLLQEITSILHSEAIKPQMQHWEDELDELHENAAIQLAQSIWWHKHKDIIAMNNAIIQGQIVATEGITEAEKNENLALFAAANARMQAERIQHAVDIQNSRSFKRAERLIASAIGGSTNGVAQAIRNLQNNTIMVILHDNTLVAEVRYDTVAAVMTEVEEIDTTSTDSLEAGLAKIGNTIQSFIHPEALFMAQGANSLSANQQLELARGWFTQFGAATSTARTDTFAGQLFHGVAGALQAAPEWGLRSNIVDVLSNITGIAKSTIMGTIRPASGDVYIVPESIAALETLFIQAGYELNLPNTISTDGTIVSADPNKNAADLTSQTSEASVIAHTYNQDETIRIRFDVREGNSHLSHVHVYVLDEHGEQLGDFIGNVTSFGTSGQLFVEVPAADVLQKLQYSTASGRAAVTLKLAAWFTPLGATPNTADGMLSSGTTVQVLVDTTGIVLPVSIENYLANNAIDISHYSSEEQVMLINALGLETIQSLPANNQAIILEFMRQHIDVNATNTLTLQPDGSFKVEGFQTELECKGWLQQEIILKATGVLVGGNTTQNNESATWKDPSNANHIDNQVDITADFKNQGLDFWELVKQSGATAGDTIQYFTESQYQHTMVISSITENGMWVFDTNFVGELSVGLHYFSAGKLNDIIEQSSIYRIINDEI